MLLMIIFPKALLGLLLASPALTIYPDTFWKSTLPSLEARTLSSPPCLLSSQEFYSLCWVKNSQITVSLLKIVSSKDFLSFRRSSSYTIILMYKLQRIETGTFINFVNNLGAAPSPKHRQRNSYTESSHSKRTYFLDCLFNETQKQASLRSNLY